MVVWRVEVTVTSTVEMPSSPWPTETEADAEGTEALTLAEEVEADEELMAKEGPAPLGARGESDELAAEQARRTTRRFANVPRRSTGIGTAELSNALGRRSSSVAPARWARERERALCRAWLASAE